MEASYSDDQHTEDIVQMADGAPAPVARDSFGASATMIGPTDLELPAHCGVVGGGRMGAGIAHALLLAGARVIVVERDDVALEGARSRIDAALVESVRRGHSLGEAVRERIVLTTSSRGLSSAGLVIEAVPEDADLKLMVLRHVEEAVAPDAVIATNTSSISLALLGRALNEPRRFLGLHFFNPVPASKLVEIVIAPRTDPHLADRASGWVRRIGKTPVVVRDSPGFASSRLGVALGLEAIRMLEQGVASAQDIDMAMTLGYAHAMGPLRLTDIIGLDVRLSIARYLERELGPRFAPPQLLIDMVARGDLGRKTGRGFYDWTD